MGQALTIAIATEALANTPIGILILDQNGRVVWLNHALEILLDITAERLLGQSAATTEAPWRALLFAPEKTLLMEGTATRPVRWLQTWQAPLKETGGALHCYADITEFQNALEDRARLNEELTQHTTRDTLTGLPNRQALLQELEPLITRSRRYHNPLSVIRLHIDNLADIDAAHGKGNGDAALTAIAQMLKDQTRWADLVGRFDKDEFLLVLPETGVDAATHLLDKLRHRIAQLALPAGDGQPIAVVARFGIADWQQGDDRVKLLRRAREHLEKSS